MYRIKYHLNNISRLEYFIVLVLLLEIIVLVWGYSYIIPFFSEAFFGTLTPVIKKIIEIISDRRRISVEAKVLNGEAAINKYILEFFDRASTVEIVSHDASWIESSVDVQKEIKRLVKKSKTVDIWVGKKVNGSKFKNLGMNVKNYNSDTYKPNARFTIINRGRAGAEQLAISTGTNKEHEIYIFNNSDHPYMIALAKDILYLLEGDDRD
ncbi:MULTISPECIES: hypothetical protein [Veillonella]|jgi:hypothetical protein|uniref:Uncharacterized protein n=1 Tax=Veillonella nakazawae TaxID=2682456 RepID=A0ABM7HD86_9FIRM|nr:MULTISPECIES: hypothetical protein [Veillonella]MBS6660969.1 hypothetical protein [Veillonella sp.]BBU34978.1 hypothetical protein VEIT17_14240 [Veillonella nakazawae]